MRPNIIKETFKGYQCTSIPDELFRRRTLYFTAPIGPSTAEELIGQLLWLEQAAPGKPITLVINSPGGDVFSGLAVCDVISQISSPVDTVCAGMAASMGALVFLCGRNRTMFPHSRLLIHDPSFSSGDLAGVKPIDLKEDLEKLMAIRTELAQIIADRTGKSLEDILEKTKTDFIMTAQEALEMGAATRIGILSLNNEKEDNEDE